MSQEDIGAADPFLLAANFGNNAELPSRPKTNFWAFPCNPPPNVGSDLRHFRHVQFPANIRFGVGGEN